MSLHIKPSNRYHAFTRKGAGERDLWTHYLQNSESAFSTYLVSLSPWTFNKLIIVPNRICIVNLVKFPHAVCKISCSLVIYCSQTDRHAEKKWLRWLSLHMLPTLSRTTITSCMALQGANHQSTLHKLWSITSIHNCERHYQNIEFPAWQAQN